MVIVSLVWSIFLEFRRKNVEIFTWKIGNYTFLWNPWSITVPNGTCHIATRPHYTGHAGLETFILKVGYTEPHRVRCGNKSDVRELLTTNEVTKKSEIWNAGFLANRLIIRLTKADWRGKLEWLGYVSWCSVIVCVSKCVILFGIGY